MSEKALWNALRKAVRHLDPVRVENPVHPGTPDVNLTTCWVELKYERRWPPRGGPLRVPHFTPQQRVWLHRRSNAGGRCYVLLKVGRSDLLLIEGGVAANYLGQSPKEDLIAVAAVHADDGRLGTEFIECLQTENTASIRR